MIPSALELEYPWLLLLLPLPLVVRLLVPPYRAAKEAVRAPFFTELAKVAGVEPTPGAVVRRRERAQVALLAVGWLLVVVALARPKWVDDPITRVDSARDLMLAVDLSGSMETRDFRDPDGERIDRLAAVKLVLDDFVTRRETDRLGLIVFGAAAFLQAPFTLDHDVFRELVDQTAIGMAGPHTMLGDAIGLAIKAFAASDAEQRVLIVLTDGNDTESKVPPAKAAAIAAQNDITIHTIGIGDPAAAGEQPLDETTLRTIAETTGGQFFRASDRAELEAVYARLDRLEPLDYESHSYRPEHEMFAWPVTGLLVLVLSYHLVRMRQSGRRPKLPTEEPL